MSAMTKENFEKLDSMRWALVEKKYKSGLSADDHVTLDMLAATTFRNRHFFEKGATKCR